MTVFRNYEEFKSKIESCGIKAVEVEYAKDAPVPNLVYFRSADNSIYADGAPIIVMTEIAVELYTAKSDNKSEKIFESWLRENEISYQKTERVWLTTEKWYQTVYEFELIFDE